MSESDRGYAWGLQADYQTQKPIAADALTKMICTDTNTIDYEVLTNNDESWSQGANQATEQWKEAHDDKVQHTIPAHPQEMGKVFIINCGGYQINTPEGAVTAKEHVFKPTDPSVTRQDRAVTYAEKVPPGYNVLSPRCVGDGFTLKGTGLGVLMLDFGLQGAGALNVNSPVTWSGANPTVKKPTGLHKFFNTQIGLIVDSGKGTETQYGCRYRDFEFAFRKTLKLEAGYKPGCQEFIVPEDPTSGVIRSACEFDKQMLDFRFGVDMGVGSPELLAVQQQRPLDILLTATGGIIEGAIRHKLTWAIPVAYYKTSKPTFKNNVASFDISGSAFFDYVTNKLFELRLVTNVASFATGW
jgi:hypothetical protein